ncbi:hypothetical protein Naga_100594g1 [Nannochloropsis gaditana]|uniref:Uncharacterized protein n=1 Tax=Nannochloropsis gaditana TaxID=72520 RepID=W7T8V3_9STRA|nr:hypothetical protein Naga_100594g1 [Nannochloropsis gaditana]
MYIYTRIYTCIYVAVMAGASVGKGWLWLEEGRRWTRGGNEEGRGGRNGPWWKDACGKSLFEGTDFLRSHMLAQWEGDGRIRRPGVEGRI